MTACFGCPLGTGPVVGGEGPQPCRIMVIGEAPGYHEAKQGRPFVGPAGEFLGLCLAEAKWKREDIFVSNLVACRPPGNRVPTVAERRACRPRLDAEIASRKPQVILLLGATAIADFLPGVALKAHHGLPQGRYVPMFHPAAALHRPGLRAALLADWRRLPGLLEAPQQPDTKWAVVPGKMVPPPGLVAVDTETDGDRLLVVSASWQPGVAIIAPQIDLSGDHLVLFHNAKFDIKVLGQVPPKMADTMVSAFLCVAPQTPILKADLSWSRADNLQAGDKLVGFDEVRPGAQKRRLRLATVVGTAKRHAICYDVVLEDGRVVRCSADHRWMTSRAGCRAHRWLTTEQMVQRLQRGARLAIRSLVSSTWEAEESREAGWLAGIFDGEGSLCASYGNGARLLISQNLGPVLDAIKEALGKRGFDFYFRERQGSPTSRINCVLQLKGGLKEILQFLGTIRPKRINWRFWVGMAFPRGREGTHKVVVREIRPAGMCEVVSLSTDTGTFIANGLAAHNCGEESLGLKVLAHRRLGVQMQKLGPLLGETTDLMLAEYLARAQTLELLPKQRKSLQAVLEAKDQTTALNRRHGLRKVIGEPPSATVADVQRLLPRKFYSYSAADADMTLRLWPGLLQEMKEKKAEHLFWDIEMPLVPVLAKMEQRGLAIDRSRAKEVRADLAHKRDEIGQRLRRQLGLENPASPLQVAHALFEVLGLSMLARTESGAPSTAKWVLETLSEEEPLAGDILNYRHYNKLMGTYLDPWIATEGRIHAEFNQVRQFDDDTAEGATATGRLSSSGPNLQNVPIRTPEGQAVRSCVVAESGLLYAFDYSQIELLLMALDAEDEEMLRVFREGGDLHQETADLLGVDRFTGKTINFAWGYGVRAGRLAQALTLGGRRTNRQEAERLLAEFERRRPKLRQWWNHRAALAQSRGYEETFWGRRRYVPDLVMAQSKEERYEAAKKAVNHRSQGTAADICKAALVAVEALLQRHGVRPGLVCVVHDELLVEGALTPELQRGIIKAMLAPAKIPLLKVEVKCGLNWGEMFDVK